MPVGRRSSLTVSSASALSRLSIKGRFFGRLPRVTLIGKHSMVACADVQSGDDRASIVLFVQGLHSANASC